MKQFLKVDEEVIKVLKAAGRADLLEKSKTQERADYEGLARNVNLRELVLKFPHVVISGDPETGLAKVYCFSGRSGKEFKWYFRSVK